MCLVFFTPFIQLTSGFFIFFICEFAAQKSLLFEEGKINEKKTKENL